MVLGKFFTYLSQHKLGIAVLAICGAILALIDRQEFSNVLTSNTSLFLYAAPFGSHIKQIQQAAIKEQQPSITQGSLVSLECYQPLGLYMRHANFMLLATSNDNSENFKLASSWIVDAGLDATRPEDGSNTVSIRSLEFPDYYVRIMNGFTVVLQQLNISDHTFLRDATFIVRRGLAEPNQFSFEHLPQPGVFLRQLNDQVVAAKREETFQFKDDATWFIRPAVAKVNFMSIEFDHKKVEKEFLNDSILFETKYQNSGNLPQIFNYLQDQQQGLSSTERFIKTSGFNLIKGMTYRINALVPRVDANGDVFFTLKTVREWSYGLDNEKKSDMLFDQVVVATEQDTTILQVVMKSVRVRIPFEAQIRFEGVNYSQSYNGIWQSDIIYDYQIVTKQVNGEGSIINQITNDTRLQSDIGELQLVE